MRQVSKAVTDPELVVPTDSLPVLSELDLAKPDSMSRLRRGLFQHVLAGTLLANQASQAMRFAEAEAAAAPRTDGAALSPALRKLTKGNHPPGGGFSDTGGEVGTERVPNPHTEVPPGST